MKKILLGLIFLFTISSISFFACKKAKVTENNVGAANTKSTISKAIKTQVAILRKERMNKAKNVNNLPRIHIRFRWSGFSGQECTGGGDCGGCLGLCVYFTSTYGDLTDEEKAEGLNYVELYQVSPTQVVMIPYASADNGDGKTTIKEDWSMGTPAANSIGANELILKNGRYDIDYDNDYPYGMILFDSTIK